MFGEQRRDHAALRGPRQRLPHRPVFHHPGFEPLSDQLQDSPIRHAPFDQTPLHAPIDPIEEAPDVRVDDEAPTPVDLLPEDLQGLRRAPLRTETEGTPSEVRFEDRLEHELRRPLHHSVPHRRDPERPLPTAALLDVPPSHRARAVPACPQSRLDLGEPFRHAENLDRVEALRIDARRSAICAHSPPRFPEDVTPPDPVIERMEAPRLAPLGTPPERALQFSHFVFGVVGPCGHALALTRIRTHDRSRGPSLHRLVSGFPGTTTPSDSLLARRDFTLCAYTRRSTQRGLRGRASPVPCRPVTACRRQYPGETQRRLRNSCAVRGLRRDMTGSALSITFRLKI